MFRKINTVVAIVGIICLSSAIASASIIPAGYNGPVVIKLQSYAAATVYTSSGSAVGAGAVNALPQIPAGGGMVIPSGPYAGQTEDSWFIFKVTSIETPSTEQLWVSGKDGQELVGIAYGGVDVAVGVSGLAALTDGLHVDLYTQLAGTFNASHGSAYRTGYASYTGVTGGTLFLSADAIPGIGITTDLAAIDPLTFSGLLPTFSSRSLLARTDLYLDVQDGVGTDGSKFLPTPKTDIFGGGAFADLYATSSFILNNGLTVPIVGDWGFIGNDPVRGYVPEPATLGLLAIGGLALIRRRRR